jgi:NTE family protein
MGKKVVLVLQGGGALGAFECGVWKALAPLLKRHGHTLAAVAGASIGAVNGALIARNYHEDDYGSSALETFWRKQLTMPPFPFIPMPGEYVRAWNGLLTGLLIGNRSLFSPTYQHWHPLADLFRFSMPLYQTGNAVQTLSRVFGQYQGDQPVLLTAATDVKSGELVIFDSIRQAVTPDMVVASTSIPILFPPTQIDGRYFWDAEMRSNSLLPDLLEWLSELAPEPKDTQVPQQPDDYLVIMVDMFSAATDDMPTSMMQSAYRLMNIVLGTKAQYGPREFDAANAHIEAIKRLRDLGSDAPPALKAAIDEEYHKVVKARRAHVDLVTIGRNNLRHEHISRDFDYSPQYIDRLIMQGAECLRAALDGHADFGGSASGSKAAGEKDEAPPLFRDGGDHQPTLAVC